MKVAAYQWFVVALFTISLLMAAPILEGKQQNDSKQDSSAQQEKKSEDKKTASGDPAKGKEVFEANCSMCHDPSSNQTIVGPGLKNLFHWPPHTLSDGTKRDKETVESVRKQVVEGGGAMDAVGASFSDQELNDLISFLQTL